MTTEFTDDQSRLALELRPTAGRSPGANAGGGPGGDSGGLGPYSETEAAKNAERSKTSPLIYTDEEFPEPTAGMVLHRVLAGAARTFLLNDMGDELVDENKRSDTIDALSVLMRPRPLWASRPPPSSTASSGVQTPLSASTRAGSPSVASAPTCGHFDYSSTRHGEPPCGLSWLGTETGSANYGTFTSLRRSSPAPPPK